MSYNTIDILLNEYNEKNWNEYIKLFPIDKSPYSDVPDDIWTVLVFHVGKNYANKWLNKPIPAIGYSVPIVLIKNPEYINALRAILMRFPC